MLVIEVSEAKIESRDVVGKRDGKSYTFYTQPARLALNGEVRKIDLAMGKDQAPYPVGKYTFGDDAFQVDRFGRFSLKERLPLRPVAVPAQQQPQAVRS